jgi:hypothetical protein
MIAYQGYAGFWRPGDIVADKVLSDSQKAETLLHWRRAVARLAPLASAEEREAYQKLTMELSTALAHIDNSAPTPHILPSRSLKSSQT